MDNFKSTFCHNCLVILAKKFAKIFDQQSIFTQSNQRKIPVLFIYQISNVTINLPLDLFNLIFDLNKKTFYDRETNEVAFCVTSMQLKQLTIFLIQWFQQIMKKERNFSQLLNSYTPYCFSSVEYIFLNIWYLNIKNF